MVTNSTQRGPAQYPKYSGDKPKVKGDHPNAVAWRDSQRRADESTAGNHRSETLSETAGVITQYHAGMGVGFCFEQTYSGKLIC